MAKQETVPTVAPRNDPASLEPYRKSRATQIAGQRPGFTYEWFRPDQLDVKLRQHEIGNTHTGFLMVDGWEAVPVDKIELPGPGMPSAGKPLDTVATNGELILCCTPDANYAKYAVIEKAMDALIDKRLTGGEQHSFGNTTFRTRTAGGKAGLSADPNDILAGVQ